MSRKLATAAAPVGPGLMTVAVAKRLYRKHGLKPASHILLGPDMAGATCASLVALLVVERLGLDATQALLAAARAQNEVEECVFIGQAIGLDPDYASGLCRGFSPGWTEADVAELSGKPWCTPVFRAGFAEARAAKKALKVR